MKPYVLIWGGGDLASGVALRLFKTGMRLLIVEVNQPTAVRRSVSFAQAVFDGQTVVEGVTGQLIHNFSQTNDCRLAGKIPILVDPELKKVEKYRPLVLIDARMRKKPAVIPLSIAEMVIGLGPGFEAGENCHAAIETNRGHFLGRVYWQGSPEANTGIPGKVGDYSIERVLRAPSDGIIEAFVAIGEQVHQDDLLITIGDYEIRAPFNGVLRGLIQPGLHVKEGMKVGDVDPRPENYRCWTVSDKALAIGGGVLEAILTKPKICSKLWAD